MVYILVGLSVCTALFLSCHDAHLSSRSALFYSFTIQLPCHILLVTFFLLRILKYILSNDPPNPHLTTFHDPWDPRPLGQLKLLFLAVDERHRRLVLVSKNTVLVTVLRKTFYLEFVHLFYPAARLAHHEHHIHQTSATLRSTSLAYWEASTLLRSKPLGEVHNLSHSPWNILISFNTSKV
jgi:hypothetical protein